MTPLLAIHILGGAVALAAGAMTLSLRKGGRVHVRAGRVFVSAMVAMGATAAILAPLKTVPDRNTMLGGLLACYLVLTAWDAARRREMIAAPRDRVAAAAALTLAFGFAGLAYLGFTSENGRVDDYAPAVPLSSGIVALWAGLLDLSFLRRGRLDGRQRLARHVWRICVAAFMASGSFFLGQQDVMPAAWRGSVLWIGLTFAPFAVMFLWLYRLRRRSRPLGARRSVIKTEDGLTLGEA